MSDNIKSMQLYPRAERIYADLAALGYSETDAVTVDVLNKFDQLHYHGTEALDAAIKTSGISAGQTVLEIGSGWGGCSRYLAHASKAMITGIELQNDYFNVACDLTNRADLGDLVTYQNADYLDVELPQQSYDHAVSWLALFHIPNRTKYLSKTYDALKQGGTFYAEDLYLIQSPPRDELDEFRQHLFPNSLTEQENYIGSMNAAGFDDVTFTDMTPEWTAFTSERLKAFRANRANYEKIHGADGYSVIEVFYTKMAGYFARGFVGGVRCTAKR